MSEHRRQGIQAWVRLALLVPGTLLGPSLLAHCRSHDEPPPPSPLSLPSGQLPPLPPLRPVPLLDGAPVDLSTVMGRARKLAEAWQPDATLLGIEATLLEGKISTQAGGAAKVNFGPSRFDTVQARTGLFVVTYDKSGISGVAVKGTPGKALAEPMCAPEGVLPALADFKNDTIELRYAFDASQRPAWLMSLPGEAKPLRAFAPDDCSLRGTFVARPKR